jgi:tetratricopeptide (TPR) repeat protein
MVIPDVKGVLELDVGPTTFETRVRPDGKEVQLRAFGRPDKLEITAFLQRVTFPAGAEKCRNEWWPGTKKGPFQRDNLRETVVKDGIARVEFIVPEFQGVKVQQKNIHAYVGGGDLCAEIHLSKLSFKPHDQQLFEELLASVRLLPQASSSAGQSQNQAQPHDHDSSYFFGQGSKFYLQQNYSEAASSYQKALDLEKQERTLSKDYFRVLVDNLGMSYGIGGNLSQAKATFEYGLTQEPEYPMFFYNLACVYGEMANMNDALTQLRLVYKYKANVISGETLPDPLKDDSFRHFVDKEEFVKAVHEMQK